MKLKALEKRIEALETIAEVAELSVNMDAIMGLNVGAVALVAHILSCFEENEISETNDENLLYTRYSVSLKRLTENIEQ